MYDGETWLLDFLVSLTTRTAKFTGVYPLESWQRGREHLVLFLLVRCRIYCSSSSNDNNGGDPANAHPRFRVLDILDGVLTPCCPSVG